MLVSQDQLEAAFFPQVFLGDQEFERAGETIRSFFEKQQNRSKNQKRKVIQKAIGVSTDYSRCNYVLSCPDFNLIHELLPLLQRGTQIFVRHFPHLAKRQRKSLDVRLRHTLWQQLVINEGSAALHYDSRDQGLSMLIVLGDFVGGELISPTVGVIFRMAPGSLIFFKSSWCLKAIGQR